MRALILSLLLLASPTTAETLLDRAQGLYGSTTNPAQSCETNPHRLTFQSSPPHASFRWTTPRPDPDGQLSSTDVYDIRDVTGSTLTLQREGDAPLPETGRRPRWILRLSETGYCWGREDWSPVRCINPAVRCDNAAPIS